ncbi:MAG: hypothetical protein SFT94_03205 [Pseudanabaenaceae cyanobacterium bins.68]|nr:hypothetical protein [Pseudanabaenaceae cyanobacterium bins.68]
MSSSNFHQEISKMKMNNAIGSALLAGVLGLSGVTVIPNLIIPSEVQAQSLSSQEKITKISGVKGKPESAKLLREYYKEDLSPIGIQPGGAGMVVNLYSKKDNTTASLCTTYDVVVAIKKGKIAKFAAAEVK